MEPNREMQNHEGIEWRGQRRKSGKSGQKGGMGRGKGKGEGGRGRGGEGEGEGGEGKLGYK